MNSKVSAVSRNCVRLSFLMLMVGSLALVPSAARCQVKKPAAPAKVSAPAPHAPSATHSPAPTPGAKGGGSVGKETGSARPNNSSGTVKTTPSVTRQPGGGTVQKTATGKEITKSPTGQVKSIKTPGGGEAKFASNGKVKEVHANGVTVSHGPAGERRTMVDRPDHSRLVAEGHGRGYIQRPYSYGGHSYYSRAYYYHGGCYNAYYRGYYYNGVYLNGYMPAYYYPAAYYGWAYNPWPAPVPYAWGWGASPWYGYYGAYFVPYPVYPSAAFWLTDYLVAASLANAYALAAAANSAGLRQMNAPHLVFASYDPDTGVTSPTMTKDVKDAVSEEIKRELAAQKAAGADNNVASLSTLLADGQPHVFVVSAGLTVTAAGGDDCGLTEGDILSLQKAPAADATSASLRVLSSKKTDCAKDSAITVDLTDLQEMHNQLLSSIDKGMAEMKDHPGQGGLPAPPADAIAGTKQAPYAAAAPAADPNGAAELDKEAANGAQVEQQVVAEATAPDGTDQSADAAPQANAAAPARVAPTPRPAGPVTIALGQTPDQVIAGKGQPLNKVQYPGNKMMYIYSDMKIIFLNNKVSDVQ